MTSATISYSTCSLCEANCGIAVEHDGARVVRIRGDERDVLSRGYICPKAVALADVHADPDRLRMPVRRVGKDRWVEIGWDEALDEAGDRLAAIENAYGRDAVALYVGNPTVHSYSALLFGIVFAQTVRTRNFFSANSVDGLPRQLVSYLLYGSQALIPIPDLDRTQLLIVLGANPVVSNGSIMTAPDCRRRLRALRERGGRLVVIDPRRTETAAIADAHHFIRPGADALLLAAMAHVVLGEGLARPRRLAALAGDLDALTPALARFAPERVAPFVGIDAQAIRDLARTLAAAPSAACYGRLGTCTQQFGTLATWLVDVLNVLTGNLDREGGAMFASPAVDLAAVAARLGQTGSYARFRSRVRGLPEFNGELPSVALAEEIDTPGEGRVRALVTHAGNPVLSLPNGGRVARALASLDFMVSIDIYRNETTRLAHLILPTTVGLEHDHYPLVFAALAVHNTAKYAPAPLEPSEGARHEWEILLDLAARIGLARAGSRGRARRLGARALGAIGRAISPRRILDVALRTGPYRLSLRSLEEVPHGVDLGPLVPRLPGVLRTPDRRIRLAPDLVLADLDRLARTLDPPTPAVSLQLIGRRDLRSNNSWMHNSERLVKGKPRCTLLVHPDDAAPRGIRTGDRVVIESRTGTVIAQAELSGEMMRGVVSLPHGWGHDREGAQLAVAQQHAGVSVNDVTDDELVDVPSGCASLNGVPVTLTLAPPERSVANP